MGIKNFLEHIKKDIKKMVKVAPYFRVATIVTRKNLSQIADIADWVHECGARYFGLSLVVPMGRAVECGDEDLFLTSEELYTFNDIVDKIDKKYPGFISITPEDSERKNCGCLTDSIGIKANGEIKLCAMDNGSCLSRL